jgi:hypothetical protein
MKKWIVGLLILLILTLGFTYFLIPANIVISNISSAKATSTGEFRYISQEENWEKWWRDSDGKPHIKGQPFTFNNTSFHLITQFNNIAGIEITRDGMKLQSVLRLVSFSSDSTGAVWQCEMPTGKNPLKRIMKYQMAIEIKKSMEGVLKNLSTFASDPQNIYVFRIYRTSTRDTTLLSARFTSRTNPTTAEIYSYFDTIEKSILKQKGKKSGYPIMNIRILENGDYETQVALPTNKMLKDDGRIQHMRMVPGNFISTEVKGGRGTVDEALRQLNYFISDNSKSKVATAFQMLVTNRLEEPDTLKWITRIYIPVVE